MVQLQIKQLNKIEVINVKGQQIHYYYESDFGITKPINEDKNIGIKK